MTHGNNTWSFCNRSSRQMITDRDSVKTGKRRTRQRGRFVLPNRLPTMPTKQKLVFANDGGFFFFFFFFNHLDLVMQAATTTISCQNPDFPRNTSCRF